MGARFSTDGREAHGDRALLSFFEHVGETEIGEGVGSLVDPVGSGALGVNDPFWDPLAVEMREEVD